MEIKTWNVSDDVDRRYWSLFLGWEVEIVSIMKGFRIVRFWSLAGGME